MIFRQSLFPVLSFTQARNVSFLPRAVVSSISNLLEKPKGVGNAYTLYYTEQFPVFKKQFPDFATKDIAKRIGAKWSSLSESEKKSYKDRQSVGVEGSKQQMEQFKSSLSGRQNLALRMVRLNNRAIRGEITKRNLNAEEKAFLDALPKTPFSSGKNLFMSKELSRKDGQSLAERMVEAQEKWSSLPDSEKALMDNQAKLDQQQFQAAMKKFLFES